MSVTVTISAASGVADPRPPPAVFGRPTRAGTVDFCDQIEKRVTDERGRSRHGAGLRPNPKVDRPKIGHLIESS